MSYNKLYPLTLPQQTFYYDYLLLRNDSKYNMGGSLVLNGDLDIDLLRKAYNYVIEKYDTLRLRFVMQDGELFQMFIPEYHCNIEYLDFRNNENPFEDAMRFIIEENGKPIHFEGVNLYKEMILQTGDHQFVWFPRFHHFSNDGWGRSVVNQSIADTYNHLLADGSFPDIMSYSYLDFLEDDLKYRASNAFKDSSEFWRRKLTPLPEPMGFTLKKYGIKNFSLHNERVTLTLHRMCYAALLKIADQVGVTTFQALLGILYTTLNKLYNRNDIVIGMPVLNRSNHKFRNTPGLFMNMIPLRLHIVAEWTFADILSTIKSELKECYRHQRLPLSETFKHFRNNPEFKNELFDVTIIYRKMDYSQRLGKEKLNSVTLDTQIRNESLGLEVDEYDDNENVNIFFNYNPLVFCEQDVIQFARCFEAVLFELVYFPEKSIADVKFLSEFEQHRLVKTFNFNGEAKRTEKTIVEMFDDCVRDYSNNISIINNNESLTYCDLNGRANQVAGYLIEQHCISKGDIICMAADRSIDAVAVMIGIMKSGAVYLPVDSHHPRERIEFILENSGAKILITDNAEHKDLHEKVILLKEIKSAKRDNLSIEIHQEDLAYIIYTSGSTGTPKGVMIEHGSFMNMFVNMIENFGITENDRVLQFASLGFDAAVFEILQALLTGAALVIVEKEIILNPVSFIQYLDDKKVTVATIPPAYLSALDKPELPHLHTLITAGEQALVSDVNHYKKFKKLINAYGPTEASVCASYFITEKDKEYKEYVPIGKTVPGSSIYILNENLEQLPIGYQGELCISGPNLARGYLNNKELTEQKFVCNPFGENYKMYRTGDKARLLPDGNIEFLGRIDEQIKIRGNRIEPGEIESRLQSHSLIKDAIVCDVEINNNKVIAAFILKEKEIDLSKLRKYLLAFLPDYMVPQHLIFVDKFPLTQNGKIDKNELRKIVLTKPVGSIDNSSARTELELKLIPIFEHVLNYVPVGVNDNFFELGGDSLKIARLITHIQKELQLEINFKTIFDKPTVHGVATELELIEMDHYDEIETTPVKAYYPLSHSQRRLWILAQDEKNRAVYNMPVPLLLEGKVDVENLKHSVNTIVDRHEVLRTIFIEVEGTPYQKVLKTYDNYITEYDFSLEKNAAEKAKAFINKAVMTPFDLSNEISIRVHFIKIENEKYLFLLLIHHIAGDGISINIMMNELSQLYNSFNAGDQKFSLTPLKIQYKDYCIYEQTLLESDKYRKEKEYWLNHLQSPIPVLNLPTDKLRLPVKTYNGKYLFSKIDKLLSQDLIRFSKDNSVSPFMVLLAAVNILLHKYTSQTDIIIGSPVAGRNHHDLEDQVGVYINTVALRNTVSSGITFIDFLKNVKDISSEAFSNSNYPFDSLIQYLDLERDTSRAPLFDVLIQYQNQDVTRLKLDGIKSSFYIVDYAVNKFDLTFTFTENEGKIDFSIGYNTDLFNSERIERAMKHLLNILSRTLNNPNIYIKDIDILGDTETIILKTISCGTSLKLDEKTVVDLFEEQVRNTPDNIAVVFNDTKLSYRQLDLRVNAVANEILENILVVPDDIIGIMAPRSELMIIAILAILKTGAAYLPISPDLPQERIKFMLLDSCAKLLLTESSMIEQVNEIVTSVNSCAENKVNVLDISRIKNSFEEVRVNKLASSNLAYVMYTSGSTGTPKGVMIEHRSLYNLVLALQDRIYDSKPTLLNIALISPFIFDASVKQIFSALLNGHCLDIVPDGIKTNGRKLLEYYEDHLINVSDGTPVHLEILLDELSHETERYLPERFVVGGQQLMYQTVKKLFDRVKANHPIITNVYGPTECCDVSTCFNITPELVLRADTALNSMPIGKPLNNVQVYILDSNLAQVPLGVDGELCIGGEGLARGYVNRPDLTEEKFIEVDFEKCTKIYKTGDIGHFMNDGNIILTGRSDDQIKLRGFRIELNEIENCIRTYGKINSVAVIPIGEGNYLKIAAYYSSTEKIECENLRYFLSLHLPVYMIPSYLIELESIPVTANGKVDKRYLPLPIKEISVEENGSLPGDILEEKLSEIWKELLQLQKVNLTDNFFNLGGHSLIAIRLASRIHKEFNIEISLWEVFQHSTISSLAKLLRSKNPSIFNPIEKIEESEYYPLSHSQRRLWLLAKLEGQNSLYNLPAALRIKGKLDVQVLENVFKAIVQRHESFRTYFVEIDGEPFQKISDKVDFNIEISDYPGKEWDENTLKELAADYFQNEFDLSRPPLMQIKLMVLSEDNYLFLFNMHHIIGDGWSIDLMLKEFEVYYNSFLHHLEDPLQPLRIQYKDYAAWQNKILNEESLSVIKEYWQKKLSKPRPFLNLPTDFKRSEPFSIEGAMHLYSLDDSAVKALMDISSSQNASLYMALLSAVYILLYKYTSEEDIMLGSPVAGRQHYDLENQVGFFINTLVLRNEVNPENSFQKLLSKVNKTLTEAFDSQVYPFDRLVDELDVERIPNRNPLFDVMVAWMVKNGMEIKMSFNGIEVTGLDFRIAKSMFDLTFLFEENEGKVAFGIEYNTSLFKEESIQRMAEHFKILIESITLNPKGEIKYLNIISANEKEKLLFGFNETVHQLRVNKNVIDLFSYQARINRNNIALVYGEKKIIYEELDKLSNRIANHIIERVAPKKDDIIAVIIDDAILAVASMLAVMKTGAAYLPILSDNPPERISFMLADSKSIAVLVDSNMLKDNSGTYDYKIDKNMIFDARTDISENQSIPENKIEKNSLAYIIYTSGSTGTPKGVMIEHDALSNLILSLHVNVYSHYKYTVNELMISSFAFDVSLKQVFATLCNGNVLHILSKERKLDAREIIKYIVSEKINITDLTPSLFSVMLEEGFGEAVKPDLKEIFLGSEALPFKLIKTFYRYRNNHKINITNFYGPTECCVESSFFKFQPEMLNEAYDIAPIGKPILNEQIYVLDNYLNLCPVGIPGEICIAGKGLARRYLNDPEKTSAKFIQFPLLNGTRIYKTGDLGRRRSDGNLEFLGRIDEQVKVRGYRVELQEIEKHLRELKTIKECAVTLFEKDGTSELAAYFTSDETIDQAGIKSQLERFLPKYMVPSYFIQLEKIPLSANGKVNKKLLPDPSELRKKNMFREPQDEAELFILQIVADVLKKEKISLEDNFFEIGGNSLNAVRVISRIQRDLNIELTLMEIFYHPVLFDIAAKVRTLRNCKDTLKEKEDETLIVPISDDELELLSNLQFDDDEE